MRRYIYICAAGHSGSTLLDLLIGSHSNVESLGEITQLPKNIALNTTCMCGLPVRTCGFWNAVLDSMKHKTGVNFSSRPYALNLGFINAKVIIDKARQTPIYNLKRMIYRVTAYLDLAYGPGWMKDVSVLNNLLVYDTVMDVQGVNYIVDSSKDYLKGVKLYRNYPKRTKIILLARDGRGVFYSSLKRGRSRKNSLRPWVQYYRHALTVIHRHIPESDYLVIKYEDIAMHTDRELRKICDFVGLAYEPKMIDFLKPPHHITNGNNMRFASTSEIKFDSSWKNRLSPADIDYFNSVGGEINSQLGYH